MTMRIEIKNADTQRVAKCSVEDYEMGRADAVASEIFTIAPGESRAVYVHARRRVVLTEDAMAARPAPTGETR